jgi:hypothetical protein
MSLLVHSRDGTRHWLMLGGILLASVMALMVIPVTPPALADAPVGGCYGPGDSACFAVTAQPGVNVRSGPGTNYPVVGWLTQGMHICQVMGENVGGNAIWDYVGSGGSSAFVADFWMDTPTYGTDPTNMRYSCP